MMKRVRERFLYIFCWCCLLFVLIVIMRWQLDLSKPEYYVKKSFSKKKQVVKKLDFSMKVLDSTFYEAEKSLKRAYRKTYLEITKNQSDRWILEPKCKTNNDVIILIKTNPKRFLQRAAIRLSWGKSDNIVNKAFLIANNFTYQVIFAVGKTNDRKTNLKVQKESDINYDILRLDYWDTYQALVNKSMESFIWISENCLPKHLMQVDSDCFVNIPALVKMLQSGEKIPAYSGNPVEGMGPIRVNNSRYYVSYEDFPDDTFPDYCSGPGFLLTQTALLKMVKADKKTKRFPNDDAYIGHLAKLAGIPVTSDARFLPYVWSKVRAMSHKMCAWKSKVVMHEVDHLHELLLHWRSVLTDRYKFLCKEQNEEIH